MSFLDPKQQQDDDELPGTGLRLDLDVKACPSCRREALPWEKVCPDCGVPTVAATELPPRSFPLPHLDADDEEAGDDPAGGPADDPVDG